MVIASVSGGLLLFDAVIIAILLIWLGSAGLNRWRRKRYATVIDQADFQKGSHRAQVIDVRNKEDFDRGHILGARSIPLAYMKQQMGDLRADLPVYLYDEGMTLSTQAAAWLAKQGFQQVYILDGGFAKWTGKTKKAKY